MTAVTTAAGQTTDQQTGERWYEYPPTGQLLDSVTTVISATDSKPWIATWHGTSSTRWCVDNIDLLAKTLKTEGRQAAIDLGKTAAKDLRNIKREAGTYVHDVVERLVLWAASPGRTGSDIALPVMPDHLAGAEYDGEPLPDVADWMVTGFLNWVTDFGPEIQASEMQVYCQPMGYAGTLDLIVKLTGYAISFGTGINGEDEIVAAPGQVLVICVDIKTGRNPDGTWKEQLAAYRRTSECRMPLGDLVPMPRTHCGAVLHLRPDYPDGYLLMLVSAKDDEPAWRRFQKACDVYRDRQQVKDKPGPSFRPLRADGTMPGPRLCDLAGEGYGRALAPLRNALGAGAELEDVAAFTRAEMLAVRGVGPKLIESIAAMLADHGLSLAGEAA